MSTGTKTKLCRTEWVLNSAVRTRLADETAGTCGRILSLGETVDAVVEQYHIEVDVSAHGMDEVVSTNGKSVAITTNLPNGKVWIGYLCSCGDGSGTTVDGLHGVGIHIVGQAARTSDT